MNLLKQKWKKKKTNGNQLISIYAFLKYIDWIFASKHHFILIQKLCTLLRCEWVTQPHKIDYKTDL